MIHDRPIQHATSAVNAPLSFDQEGMDRFTRDWEVAFDQGAARAMAGCYADEARLIASQSPTVEGRSAIEHFWQAACEHAKSVSLKRTVELQHLESVDNLGYARGIVTLQAADSPTQTVVRYVTVWKREADGAWRCIVDISSPQPPT
jgi:uncharacterized protein (TIGR02246 family)